MIIKKSSERAVTHLFHTTPVFQHLEWVHRWQSWGLWCFWCPVSTFNTFREILLNLFSNLINFFTEFLFINLNSSRFSVVQDDTPITPCSAREKNNFLMVVILNILIIWSTLNHPYFLSFCLYLGYFPHTLRLNSEGARGFERSYPSWWWVLFSVKSVTIYLFSSSILQFEPSCQRFIFFQTPDCCGWTKVIYFIFVCTQSWIITTLPADQLLTADKPCCTTSLTGDRVSFIIPNTTSTACFFLLLELRFPVAPTLLLCCPGWCLRRLRWNKSWFVYFCSWSFTSRWNPLGHYLNSVCCNSDRLSPLSTWIMPISSVSKHPSLTLRMILYQVHSGVWSCAFKGFIINKESGWMWLLSLSSSFWLIF